MPRPGAKSGAPQQSLIGQRFSNTSFGGFCLGAEDRLNLMMMIAVVVRV